MLVPVASPVLITPSLNGGNMVLSFPTDSGFSYQVQYKNGLIDASWSTLGTAVEGNGAVQSVNDPATGSSRFYRLQVQ